jgi:hypothetical protein
VLALGLDMLPPGQLTVEVKGEVLNVGFYRDRGSVQEHRRESNRSRGEGNMCGLGRVDVYFPHSEPVMEEGLVALEVLGGDCRIRMDRKEPRVIPESRDGGGFRRGLICGEEEVEKRGKNTDLGDTRSHHMAGGARRIIPDLENAYLSPCGHTGSSCGAVRSPPTPKSSNAYSTKPSAPSPTPPGMSITANYTPAWASPSLPTRSANIPFATISGWPVTKTFSLLPCQRPPLSLGD